MRDHASDFNLLFGFLARQLGFVDRQQFQEATRSWRSDTSQPVSEILLNNQSISEEDHKLLRRLTDKCVSNHQGDPTSSLKSLAEFESFAAELQDAGNVSLDDTVSMLMGDRSSDTSAPTEPLPASARLAMRREQLGAGANRYQIIRPHARGGLGEVSIAKDLELNRDVALKAIQERFADDSGSRSRFLMEAEVTGRLEHPGIVPVYGLGIGEQGRPYYAMRFIKGESLQEAVDRFHEENKEGGADPLGGLSSIRFRQLLGRFVDVCDAVEFAHSRGVLHRDLKPGNIMLGDFGETLVVDWGLARVQPTPDNADEVGHERLDLANSLGGEPTQMGHVVGTPAYMPPEQASGQLDELDASSDVYALGATLYYALTGTKPIRGKSVDEVIAKTISGDVRPPRSVNRYISKPLDAICRKAMATDKSQRYRTCRELRDDVECFLADESVSSYDEPLWSRVRRFARTHRTIATTTLVAVSMFVVALLVFSTIVTRNNAQLSKLNGELDNRNQLLDDKNMKLVEANVRERRLRDLAERNELAAIDQSELALSTLADVIFDLQRGLAEVAGSGEVRRRLLLTSLQKLKLVGTQFISRAPFDQSTIGGLVGLGDLIRQFGVEDTDLDVGSKRLFDTVDADARESATLIAQSFYDRAHEIASQQVMANNRSYRSVGDLAVTHERRGTAFRDLGQLDEALDEYETLLALSQELSDREGVTLKDIRFVVVAHERIGTVLEKLGRHSESLQEYLACQPILLELVSAEPDNSEFLDSLAINHSLVGTALLKMGEPEQAYESYLDSLAIHRQLADDQPANPNVQRRLASAHKRVGEIQLKQGETTASLDSFQQSLSILLQQYADDPSDLSTQFDLAKAHANIGNIHLTNRMSQEAVESYEASLELLAKVVERDQQNADPYRELYVGYLKLSQANLQMEKLGPGEESLDQAIAIASKLAAESPENAEAQRDLSSTFDARGDFYLRVENPSEALVYFRKAHEIRKRNLELDANSEQAQRDMAVSAKKIGQAFQEVGQFSDAADSFQQAIEVFERVGQASPGDISIQRGLADAYRQNGDVQLQLGKLQAAYDAFKKSKEICEAVTAVDATNKSATSSLSESLVKMGDVLTATRQFTIALQHYQAALQIARQLAIDLPNDVQIQMHLALILDKLGGTYRNLGQADEALAALVESKDIGQRLIEKQSASLAMLRNLAITNAGLSELYLQRREFDLAVQASLDSLASFERIVEITPESVEAWRDLSISTARLGDTYVATDKMDDAFEQFEKALRIRESIAAENPGNVQLQRDVTLLFDNVGEVHRRMRAWEPALTAYRQSLQRRQQMVADHPSVQMFYRDLSLSHDRVAAVFAAQGKHKESLHAYEDSQRVTEKLIEIAPDNVQAKSDLVIVLFKIASIHQEGHNYAAAIPSYERMLVVLRELEAAESLPEAQARWPSMVTNVLSECRRLSMVTGPWSDIEAVPLPDRYQVLYSRVSEFADQARFDEAVETADRWKQLQPKEVDELVLLARGHALLIGKLREQGDELVEEQEEWLTRLTAASLSALKAAIDGGFDEIELLTSHPDFEPLQELPAFRQLLDN